MAPATAATIAAVASIPVFTAATVMSLATASIWATTMRGSRATQSRHGDGVLRGDGGDGRSPVHAVGGERAQVGLDAGSAPGVRAGDGEDDLHALRPKRSWKPMNMR